MPSSPPSDAEIGDRTPILLQALNGSLEPPTLIGLVHQLETRNLFDKSDRLIKCGLVGRPGRGDFLAAAGFNGFNRGDFNTAVRLLKQACYASPKNAEIIFNLVLAHEAAEEWQNADFWIRRLITNLPADHALMKRLAGYLLRNGRRKDAWELQRRHLRAKGKCVWETTLNDAIAFHGQLVIDMEDFLGEAVESASLLARAGGERFKKLTFRCTGRLHRFLKRTFPGVEMVNEYDGVSPIIGYEALASLVAPLKPDRAPALQVAQDRSREIRSALQAKFPGKMIVGLAWRSAPRRHDDDRVGGSGRRLEEIQFQESGAFNPAQSLWRKIAPLKNFYPLFDADHIQVISAQNGLQKDELTFIREELGLDLYEPDIDFAGDLDDIAAFLSALDALVAVPCTHAHLAGAIGVKTFVLMPEAPPSQSNWPMHDTGWLYANLQLLHKVREPGKTHYAGDWRPVIRDQIMPELT